MSDGIAGKQDALTFDSTPTEGSSNPVTSDGIYQAIHSASGLTGSVSLGAIISSGSKYNGRSYTSYYQAYATDASSAYSKTLSGKVDVCIEKCTPGSNGTINSDTSSKNGYYVTTSLSYNLSGSGTITISFNNFSCTGTSYSYHEVYFNGSKPTYTIVVEDGVVTNSYANFIVAFPVTYFPGSFTVNIT